MSYAEEVLKCVRRENYGRFLFLVFSRRGMCKDDLEHKCNEKAAKMDHRAFVSSCRKLCWEENQDVIAECLCIFREEETKKAAEADKNADELLQQEEARTDRQAKKKQKKKDQKRRKKIGKTAIKKAKNVPGTDCPDPPRGAHGDKEGSNKTTEERNWIVAFCILLPRLLGHLPEKSRNAFAEVHPDFCEYNNAFFVVCKKGPALKEELAAYSHLRAAGVTPYVEMDVQAVDGNLLMPRVEKYAGDFLFCELVEAAKTLHACSLVHNDIKAEHLRVMGERSFLIDLELATRFDTHQTAAGQRPDMGMSAPFVSLGRLTRERGHAQPRDDLETCVLVWGAAAGVYVPSESARSGNASESALLCERMELLANALQGGDERMETFYQRLLYAVSLSRDQAELSAEVYVSLCSETPPGRQAVRGAVVARINGLVWDDTQLAVCAGQRWEELIAAMEPQWNEAVSGANSRRNQALRGSPPVPSTVLEVDVLYEMPDHKRNAPPSISELPGAPVHVDAVAGAYTFVEVSLREKNLSKIGDQYGTMLAELTEVHCLLFFSHVIVLAKSVSIGEGKECNSSDELLNHLRRSFPMNVLLSSGRLHVLFNAKLSPIHVFEVMTKTVRELEGANAKLKEELEEAKELEGANAKLKEELQEANAKLKEARAGPTLEQLLDNGKINQALYEKEKERERQEKERERQEKERERKINALRERLSRDDLSPVQRKKYEDKLDDLEL